MLVTGGLQTLDTVSRYRTLYCTVLQVHLRAPALEEGGAGLPGHPPGQAHQQAGGGEQQVTACVLCPCDVAPSVAMAGVVPVLGVGG